jgi:hypothetical protein
VAEHYATAGRSRIPVPTSHCIFFNLSNPSSRTIALEFAQPLTKMSTRKYFWGLDCGRRVRLATSPLSLSRLPRKCGILNISLSHRPPRPVTRIALLFLQTHFDGLFSRQLLALRDTKKINVVSRIWVEGHSLILPVPRHKPCGSFPLCQIGTRAHRKGLPCKDLYRS